MTRIPHDEMAFELQRMLYGKTCWLADCSQGPKKRPDHEIQQKQRERDVLQQAHDDYQNAAVRKTG